MDGEKKGLDDNFLKREETNGRPFIWLATIITPQL